MNILVSGSRGFVGRALCDTLEQSNHIVNRVVRYSTTLRELAVGDINGDTDWGQVLANPVDAVVHLAARVHMMRAESEDDLMQYRVVNNLGTMNLARQCAAKGVKRFVFVSTVKVLGEGSTTTYKIGTPASPTDPYAISKWEAEQGLLEIAAQTGMEVVILRPPLVYGPGVGANFLQLMRIIDLGVPMPLGAIHNRRSLVYLGNLVDAIHTCLLSPAAVGKTYLVSDGEDVSTPALVRRVAEALERPARLLSVPVGLIKFIGKLLGKSKGIDRLLGSLVVDSSPIRQDLNWTPLYSMRDGLMATAEWYRKSQNK